MWDWMHCVLVSGMVLTSDDLPLITCTQDTWSVMWHVTCTHRHFMSVGREGDRSCPRSLHYMSSSHHSGTSSQFTLWCHKHSTRMRMNHRDCAGNTEHADTKGNTWVIGLEPYDRTSASECRAWTLRLPSICNRLSNLLKHVFAHDARSQPTHTVLDVQTLEHSYAAELFSRLTGH